MVRLALTIRREKRYQWKNKEEIYATSKVDAVYQEDDEQGADD